MATSQKAKIQIELGRTLNELAAMSDSGDQTVFTISGGTLFSGKSGYEPDVRPNGISQGSKVLSPHASNNTVAIASFAAYSKGVENSVSATSATFTRPATAGEMKIISVTMASDGSIAKVAGTASATAFTTERGVAGGPPLIPLEDVEIGQLKVTGATAGVLTEAMIQQDAGQHAEYYDYPSFDVHNVGMGQFAASASEKNAHVKFASALPQIHTGSVPKAVYIQYYSPTFTTLMLTNDFKAAEMGVSKNSEVTYEGSGVSGAIGSVKADTVGDATFTVMLKDGLTDPWLREVGEVVTVKFFSDANRTPFAITQGLLGIDRDFPSAEQNKAAATIYPQFKTVEFQS
jgi:hypothetical protein